MPNIQVFLDIAWELLYCIFSIAYLMVFAKCPYIPKTGKYGYLACRFAGAYPVQSYRKV